MAASKFVCANWTPTNTGCKKFGSFTCKNCYLMVYCGADCQKPHWDLHRKDCKSSLGKATWKPDRSVKKRTPAFVRGGVGVQFGGKKYLWGNIPALDVLQLGLNEGENYVRPLSLLFAASGDLRNVLKTIVNIPSSYSQSVDITMNDNDLDIVARNTIMLLIGLVVDNIDDATDCLIHQQIRPLIQDVCDKIKDKNSSSRCGKTWTFGRRSLRLVLEKSSWDSLLVFLDIPEGLTAEGAIQIRSAVTLADSRQDYRDRHLLFQPQLRRSAKNKFWADGLLLPFGSPRNEFQVPNSTFFQTADTWPLHDNADPLNGWPLEEIEETSSGPASADIYGKLFYHLRKMLRAFLLRLSDMQISFQLLQIDASDLPGDLKDDSFDRIEVSNITDGCYLGIHRTLCFMLPLLKGPLINPHATLIVLFMNVVEETMTNQDRMAEATPHSETTKRLLKYLPIKGPPNNTTYDPRIIKMSFARDVVTTFDHIFDRYEKKLEFSKVGDIVGGARKEKHTIIEKWPFRLNLRPGQPGAQEEFDRLLSGGVSGKERYVEWKRTHMYEDGR